VDILENEHLPYTLRTVGEIFSVSHGVIAHVLKGKNEEKKPPRNQRVLSDQDEEKSLNIYSPWRAKGNLVHCHRLLISFKRGLEKRSLLDASTVFMKDTPKN